MSGNLDFSSLNQDLVHRAATLLPEWLPGGQIRRNEYICGDLSGKPGKSLSINLNTGKWADFASEQKGGDLISLYAAIHNISQKDAFNALKEIYQIIPEQPKRKPQPRNLTPNIIQPPQGHSLPFDPNKFEDHYTYRNAKGDTLFYITRTKEKQFFPWCYTESNSWINKQWPHTKPLYNLNIIAQYPSKPILVVEGEKAARAAQQIEGIPYIVTTWCGGSNAVSKTDWTPIHNRTVLIWPDADEPGRKAAKSIAKRLASKCKSIKIIDTSTFNGGKDAADFLFADLDSFVSWAKPLAVPYPEPVRAPAPAALPPAPQSQQPTEQRDPNIPLSLEQLWISLGLTLSGTGRPHNSAHNIARAIASYKKLTGKIWYDEFHMKIFSAWKNSNHRPWRDQDYINLLIFLQDKLGIPNLTKNNVQDAVSFVAHQNVKNEPRDWVKSLDWDGAERINSLFSTYFGATESEYSRAVSRNFMISMIARIFRPGCKVDTMVILEGGQGIYKSSALKALAGKFFTENNNDMNKNDFFQAMQGFFLIELSELDAMNKAEATRIKTVLSTASDNYRAPYDRHPQVHPRQSIFVGTTNESTYLKDATGGRRFWPLRCGEINLSLISEDQEQLFAEAYAAFNSGESWWTVPDSAKDEQNERRECDPWEDIILDYLSGKEFVTITDVAVACLDFDIDKINILVSRRIGKILRIHGCTAGKSRSKTTGRLKSGFFTPDSLSQQVFSKSQVTAKRLTNYAPYQND